jgi:predicted nucleic acid-binding protein
MIVVADTSPINYLVLIKEIEVLPKLYGKIVIPEAVREELLPNRRPWLRLW